MPGPFFLRGPMTSSTATRNGLRVGAMVKVSIAALQKVNLGVAIPGVFGQFLVSSALIFRQDTHGHEKVVHGIHSALLVSQLIILIMLMFNDDNQCTIDTDLCKSLRLLSWLYDGLLVVTWGVSEASKDPYDPPAPPVVADPPIPGRPPQEVVIHIDDRRVHHHHRGRFHSQPNSPRGAASGDSEDERSVHSALDDPDAVVHRV